MHLQANLVCLWLPRRYVRTLLRRQLRSSTGFPGEGGQRWVQILQRHYDPDVLDTVESVDAAIQIPARGV